MALADHDAAHGNKAERADAEFLCTEDCRDNDVAPCLQPAIGAQFDAVAQTVEREHLVDFGKPHFPRCACIFDTRLW